MGEADQQQLNLDRVPGWRDFVAYIHDHYLGALRGWDRKFISDMHVWVSEKEPSDDQMDHIRRISREWGLTRHNVPAIEHKPIVPKWLQPRANDDRDTGAALASARAMDRSALHRSVDPPPRREPFLKRFWRWLKELL